MAAEQSDSQAKAVTNLEDSPDTKAQNPESNNQGGKSAFEDIFANPTDPRWIHLVPYVSLMDEFRSLADEYPSLSINWTAESAHWWVWPLPNRAVGEVEGMPSAPGGDLHVKRAGAQAAERLLHFSRNGNTKGLWVWLNPARDRWLKVEAIESWEAWFYAIREFWLAAREQAEAAETDQEVFERRAEGEGYSLGTSTAIGRRVWSLMVTQQKCLREIHKQEGLSTGEEIDRFEEPAGWIQSGKIAHVFKASAYFCAVLAEKRVRELPSPTESSRLAPEPEPIPLLSDTPHFPYRYPSEFPDADQDAIETVRREANRKFGEKSVISFEELCDAKEQWLKEMVFGAAPIFGCVAVKLGWNANRRRDIFKNFLLEAAKASRARTTAVQRFFELPRARDLDDALFATGSSMPIEATKIAEPSSMAAPAFPGEAEYIQVLNAALTDQGWSIPELARRVQSILKKQNQSRHKADRTTLYRIMRGETKRPQPAVRNALIAVLQIEEERALIVLRALGATGADLRMRMSGGS